MKSIKDDTLLSELYLHFVAGKSANDICDQPYISSNTEQFVQIMHKLRAITINFSELNIFTKKIAKQATTTTTTKMRNQFTLIPRSSCNSSANRFDTEY